MERIIWIQEEVDENTGVVGSGTNDDSDHVKKEKQRQEKEGDNKNNNNNNIRNRMESLAHGIILVKTKEDGRKLWTSNKAKYSLTNEVLTKELRWILHAKEDEQFVNG